MGECSPEKSCVEIRINSRNRCKNARTLQPSLRWSLRPANIVRLTPNSNQRDQFLVERPRNGDAGPQASEARFVSALRRQPRILSDDGIEKNLCAGQVLAQSFPQEHARIEDEDQFSVAWRGAKPTIESLRFHADHVIDQRACEQFHHGRQGRTLVPPKCQHGAPKRFRRIHRRPTIGIEGKSRCNGFAGAPMELYFAARGCACREVEHKRMIVRSRPRKGDWVGSEKRLGSARRGNPAMAWRQCEGCKTLFGQGLDFGPQGRKMTMEESYVFAADATHFASDATASATVAAIASIKVPNSNRLRTGEPLRN